MIKDFQELGLTGKETREQLDTLLQEKLGVGLAPMKQALCQYLQDKAETVAADFTNVAPHGDYGQLLEEQGEIAQFFKEQACQTDNWKVVSLGPTGMTDGSQILSLAFVNEAVDDGSTMEGYLFVSFEGAIRHAFVQGNE